MEGVCVQRDGCGKEHLLLVQKPQIGPLFGLSQYCTNTLHRHTWQTCGKTHKIKINLNEEGNNIIQMLFYLLPCNKRDFSRTLLFLCHFNSFTFLISHLLLFFFNYVCVSVCTFYIHIYIYT